MSISMSTGVEERGRVWLAQALGLPAGATPFAWQCELLRRFLAGELVEALDIPTGLGKTAVMAIWLVARACGAKVARRLVYVVDRRAVVDQATVVAEELREWVKRTPEAGEALGLGKRPLALSTLRGQYVDNRAWLDDPSAPAIVVGTVDMIGSRLLFSGYGVSKKMRPYHAGLLGADTLLVLDEAHLSQPFERLIEQIARGVDAQERALRPGSDVVPAFRSLSLSATGRPRPPTRVLTLSEADRAPGGTVARRLAGPKRLSLLADVGDKELPDALAREAWSLAEAGTKKARVIVFCTSREHALKVQEALEKLIKGTAIPAPCLLVGGRRVHERQAAATQLATLGFVAGSARLDSATFVIATAAGEVGVDLDADHAACDLVAWERMVQRLGRVNRRGEGDAQVTVVPTKASDEAESARRDATREVLAMLSHDTTIDVSLASLTALKDRAASDSALRELLGRATTPALLHPPLLRAHVEAWSMTSLVEHTGRPEVDPWVRGWPDEADKPQTTLLWREYLPVNVDGSPLPPAEVDEYFEAARPHLAEKLEIEAFRMAGWLEKRLKSLGKSVSRTSEGAQTFGRPDDILGVLLDGPSGSPWFVRFKDVANAEQRRKLVEKSLPGATLMFDTRVGGLRDGLLDGDVDDAPLDVTAYGGDAVDRAVPFRIQKRSDLDTEKAPKGWRTEALLPFARSAEEETAWLAIQSVVREAAESEEGRSSAGKAQTLGEHEKWTEEEALRIAKRLALPESFTEVLTTAARLHDEGKKAERWQRAFRVPREGGPYAKSGTSRPNIAALEGYRHELGSLPYAEAHPRVRALSLEQRELCLHLIAAHHGAARPTIRTTGAEEPPSRLVDRARQIALRFAALEKQWGPWGLAWWESLLRAADQTASRRNDEENADG